MHTPTPLAAVEPFRLPRAARNPRLRMLLRLAAPALERGLSLSRLNALYAALAARASGDPRPFEQRALEAIGVRWEPDPADLARIPASGPLLVVANHPFGGVDGLLLLALLRRVRPDVRLLGNHLLSSLPDLRDHIIYVDPFGKDGAAGRNVAPLREAIRWTRSGGALALFPAGEVSHARWGDPRVTDGPWDVSAGRLSSLCGAPVLAVFFEGRNSMAFQIAGLLHPRLRTAMLPREVLRPRRVSVRIGTLIDRRRLESVGPPEEVTAYLRARTYILKGRSEPSSRRLPAAAAAAPDIEAARPAGPIAAEVDALGQGAELARSGAFRVLHAGAAEIPAVLHEIGRQREIAFRAVDEGTGRPIDLDEYDADYIHLFVWNDETREVVGAYRMGPTDRILPLRGVSGLYTSTLFRYRESLLDRIGPALEMGRSFVRPEYQRHPAPLALLWKGIGHFVARHPRYRHLFGPVSISSAYRSMSRSLLLAFLRQHRLVADLARLIRPRHRRRVAALENADARMAGAVVKDLEGVDEMLREIESDRRTIPVLLRQYLKLNGVLLGFTVDPDFGGVLDGLILVDLTRVDRHVLVRYMGREGMAGFLRHHKAD